MNKGFVAGDGGVMVIQTTPNIGVMIRSGRFDVGRRGTGSDEN